jgi:hypothetical protein
MSGQRVKINTELSGVLNIKINVSPELNTGDFSLVNSRFMYFIAKKLHVLKILDYFMDFVYTWSLTLREEQRMKVCENRVLSIFGPKREEGAGEDCMMRSFITCMLHSILFC